MIRPNRGTFDAARIAVHFLLIMSSSPGCETLPIFFVPKIRNTWMHRYVRRPFVGVSSPTREQRREYFLLLLCWTTYQPHLPFIHELILVNLKKGKTQPPPALRYPSPPPPAGSSSAVVDVVRYYYPVLSTKNRREEMRKRCVCSTR